MEVISIIMLLFLIVCAVAVSVTKSLHSAVIIFMAYSLIMAILWQMLNAPDMAITEAAVGAGVTTMLFILVLKRMRGKKR
jgi:uncharacterized MnhB-related membrane protein